MSSNQKKGGEERRRRRRKERSRGPKKYPMSIQIQRGKKKRAGVGIFLSCFFFPVRWYCRVVVFFVYPSFSMRLCCGETKMPAKALDAFKKEKKKVARNSGRRSPFSILGGRLRKSWSRSWSQSPGRCWGGRRCCSRFEQSRPWRRRRRRRRQRRPL